VHIPVIASGGAGKPQHLAEVLTKGRADAALIASMVHYRTYTIAEIKKYLNEQKLKQECFGSLIIFSLGNSLVKYYNKVLS
jgi:cyclase